MPWLNINGGPTLSKISIIVMYNNQFQAFPQQYQSPSYYQPQQPYQQYQTPYNNQPNQQYFGGSQQNRSSSMALRGQSTLGSVNSSTQQLLRENQMIFQDIVRKRQMQSVQQQDQLAKMLERQSMILQGLLSTQIQNHPPPPIRRPPPPPKPFEVNLRSIMLKPLEYYSQQMNQVMMQPGQMQQMMPRVQQQQPQNVADVPQSRMYGYKAPKPQMTSIELQTDDTITEYEKFVRMGMANTVNFQQEGQNWGPGQEGQEQGEQAQQNQIGNPNYQKGKDWNFQVPGQKKPEVKDEPQARQKSRPLPPGMNKEQRAKHNFKVFKLGLSYMMFYWMSFLKQTRAKRQFAMEQKGTLAISCLQAFVIYFKATSGKVIQTFCQSKLDFFVTDKKKVLEEEMKKRILNVKGQVKKLFMTLIDNFDGSKIPQEHIDFLGTIMHDYEYLPQNFLFIFEINRFEYTQYGSLKNMNIERGRMLIITLLFIRVYLFRMILKPWTDFPDIKKKEQLVQNCIQVGTVLYDIVIEYVKNRCFKIGQNQAHLNQEFKNFHRSLGPLVLDRYELPEDPQELRLLREQEEPLILGLESREDMKTILDEDSAFVTEMEAYLEEWADSIYDLIKTRYAIAKATKRKERFTQKIQFIQNTFAQLPGDMSDYLQQAHQINEKQQEQKHSFHKA